MIILAPEILDPEDIPLCPLCDQPILDWQEVEVADPVETLVAGLLAASESNQVAMQLAEAAMRRDPTPNNYAGFVPCGNPGGTYDR